MELELKKLFDTVTSIHDEMFYLRERYKHNFSINKNSVTHCTPSDSTCTLATCVYFWERNMENYRSFSKKKATYVTFCCKLILTGKDTLKVNWNCYLNGLSNLYNIFSAN